MSQHLLQALKGIFSDQLNSSTNYPTYTVLNLSPNVETIKSELMEHVSVFKDMLEIKLIFVCHNNNNVLSIVTLSMDNVSVLMDIHCKMDNVLDSVMLRLRSCRMVTVSAKQDIKELDKIVLSNVLLILSFQHRAHVIAFQVMED